jgi:Uma2 family endonuclease
VSSAPPRPSTLDHILSLEEWSSLPEDEPGELVDGRLEEEEMPDVLHEVVVAWLIQQLRNWLAGKGGIVVGSEAKYRVRADRGRKPDVTVFLPGGNRPPRRGLVRVPPGIAIEVVSPAPRDGRRDRLEKPTEYAAFGVRWYWLVDPQLRSLEVLELRPDGIYGHVLGAADGKVANVPGCPDLVLDLDELWREIDLLGPEESGE